MLVVATLVGLSAGQIFGPMNSLPAVAEVNEHYLRVSRDHMLFLGLCAAVSACVVNLVLRFSHIVLLLTLIAVAGFWHVWFAAADPDFATYLVGALVEFLGLFLVAAVPVVGVSLLIEKWLLGKRNMTR